MESTVYCDTLDSFFKKDAAGEKALFAVAIAYAVTVVILGTSTFRSPMFVSSLATVYVGKLAICHDCVLQRFCVANVGRYQEAACQHVCHGVILLSLSVDKRGLP